jgi:hypothetical protein
MEDVTTLSIEWSIAHRSMDDAAESGDLCVVQPFPDGIVVAVLDGAGHGREAGLAVSIAAKILESHAEEGPSPPAAMPRRPPDHSGRGVSLASIRTSEAL